jgi:hypothetical protein
MGASRFKDLLASWPALHQIRERDALALGKTAYTVDVQRRLEGARD